MLKLEQIHYRIGEQQILNDISIQFEPGKLHMILGPNGSGKSSLLKIFSGEHVSYQGVVYYQSQNIRTFKKEVLAKFRAVMSQQPELSFPLSVDEVIMMGRYPHFSYQPSKKDLRICEEVIERMQLGRFKNRNYLTLSGGEKQRVQFARVLAQIWEPPTTSARYLFLDEPLASLDIHYQQQFLELALALKDENTVLIAVMHDLNLAMQYADRLIFLKDGALLAQGSPASIISKELIQAVFSVEAEIIKHPSSNQPLVIFDRSHK